jgi:hypothetical protein
VPRPPPASRGRRFARGPARSRGARATGDRAAPTSASAGRASGDGAERDARSDQSAGNRSAGNRSAGNRSAGNRSAGNRSARKRQTPPQVSGPGATHAAGRSALVTWDGERRARRRRSALAVLLVVVAFASLVGWALQRLGVAPSSGGLWPLLAIGVGAGGAAVAIWPRFDPDRWARGAAGELATAVLLEELPRGHWVVLHDLAVPGSRANVDHLVIGPTGVWVVDTKAYRARVTARRGRVTAGGVPLSTAPVRWEASVVSKVLGREARPLIAVHGRGLPRRGRRLDGVRVLPAERLVRRLQRGQHLWPSLRVREVRKLAALAEARLGRQ